MRIALLGVILLCCGAFVHAQDEPQVAAEKAAKAWSELLDSGRYGESWDQSAAVFQQAVTKEQWVDNARKVRDATGKLKTRTFKAAQAVNDPPNQPPGRYFIVQYDSVFDAGPAIETVVPRLEADGTWRVAGYFVKPPGQ